MFYGQIALEDEMTAQAYNDLLICDTTFITVKIWSDEMFGSSPKDVLDELPKRPYDLYLLLDIDMPWEDDPLRDFPTCASILWKCGIRSLIVLKLIMC
ncbi:AAA family ATPase [Mucilaginibacter antarcticus]|uniref:AAA family ATPase n=1 Tax=Mucilaginibacter antarcticus TaxID=1855725 RepID=UPI003628CD08